MYNQFASSLDNELHSRSSNIEKPSYVTHLNGQRCFIACNQPESSVVFTGPGRSLWSETTFLRLSLRLFQHFAADHVVEKSVPKTQTSTPIETRHQAIKNVLLSPVPLSGSLDSGVEDMNGQVKMLCDVIKTLHGQIDKINSIMNKLVVRIEEMSKRDNCSESKQVKKKSGTSQTITINDSKVEELSIVPGPKSFSDAVASQKSEIKQQENINPNDENSKKSSTCTYVVGRAR